MNRFFVWCFVSLIGLSACGNQGGDSGTSTTTDPATTITGVLSYRESKSLPPDAEVFVYLVNEANESQVVSSIDFLTEGSQIPIHFEVPYDPKSLDENGNFALKAVINFAGMKIFEEIQPVPVINNDKRKNVVVMLRSASGPAENTK